VMVAIVVFLVVVMPAFLLEVKHVVLEVEKLDVLRVATLVFCCVATGVDVAPPGFSFSLVAEMLTFSLAELLAVSLAGILACASVEKLAYASVEKPVCALVVKLLF